MRRRGLLAALCSALAASTLVFGTAGADTPVEPAAQPATADQAKDAWIAAAQSGERLNDAVLAAQQDVVAAQGAATDAQAAADALVSDVTAADVAVTAAQSQVDGFQPKLDVVADASLRGARFGELASLLTSDSADDYLDRSSALDRVAEQTLDLMAAARQAVTAADDAKTMADAKHAEAQQAAGTAAAALSAAEQAVADAKTAQDSLDDQILTYERLYSSLSASERGEAIEKFSTENVSPAAQSRLTEQAAQRAAAGISDADVAAGDISDLAVADAPDLLGGVAVAAVLTRRGLSYVWGATGPDTFDCSGLMVWAWEQAGVTIPRTSAEQSTLPEVPLDELRAGDLVTFYSPVSHVGMYVGNGLVIHASMPGVPITVVPLDKAGPSPSGHRVER